MRILRPINNNIVSACDDENREVVVTGKGIGFKVRPGMIIPAEKIDKVYIMSSKDNMHRLQTLFEAIPEEYIDLTDQILTYAKNHLDKKLNENAYFTLADHIYFAVIRLQQGMDFQNLLLQEVRRFYPQEYEVGLHALRIIQDKLGIKMPDSEAASIALHIFNAEYDISISNAFHATQLMDKIVDIVEQKYGPAVSENSYYFERFITHLKFLTQRIIKKETLPGGDEGLYDFIKSTYPIEMKCSEEIAEYIKFQHDFLLSNEEIGSLTIHIRRITNT